MSLLIVNPDDVRMGAFAFSPLGPLRAVYPHRLERCPIRLDRMERPSKLSNDWSLLENALVSQCWCVSCADGCSGGVPGGAVRESHKFSQFIIKPFAGFGEG